MTTTVSPPTTTTANTTTIGANTSTKVLQRRWICDACKVKWFSDFSEACEHEKSCKGRPAAPSNITPATTISTNTVVVVTRDQSEKKKRFHIQPDSDEDSEEEVVSPQVSSCYWWQVYFASYPSIYISHPVMFAQHSFSGQGSESSPASFTLGIRFGRRGNPYSCTGREDDSFLRKCEA